ncbi:ABC transporter permease [Candidatus Accumulibacter sp. ACC003]|uniref:ABC transporter permease n=1 Tax=Candidatus Accumulibacter sp. ACC003 TaxID=2823334 RepID=UPI0025B94658|nr:ABC transporter permease [Candidatus Accumulibacter sp. ACC003]
MLRLALRNLFRNRVRTLMTLASIVFGVVGLILSGGFVQDVYFQLGEALIHSQSGHLQVSRAGFHAKGTRSPESYLIDDLEKPRRLLAQQAGVVDVMARISFSGLLSNGRTDWPIVGEGVEPDQEAALGSQLQITAGRQLSGNDPRGILLGDGVARALQLRPGDPVTLLLTTADGALNSMELTVIGSFQSFSSDFDARAVRIPLAAAQESLATQGANTLVLSLQRTEDTARVLAALKDQLDLGYYEVMGWTQLNELYEGAVALYERQFGVLQLIILVLVLLSVANSVNMSAFERVGEFGTMMALGNRGSTVFRLLVIENVFLGIGGSLLGVALGIALAFAISAIGIPMPPPPNANIGYTAYIRVVPEVVLMAFGVGVGATILASLLPAWRVGKIAVVDALRQNY